MCLTVDKELTKKVKRAADMAGGIDGWKLLRVSRMYGFTHTPYRMSRIDDPVVVDPAWPDMRPTYEGDLIWGAMRVPVINRGCLHVYRTYEDACLACVVLEGTGNTPPGASDLVIYKVRMASSCVVAAGKSGDLAVTAYKIIRRMG